uniref:Uncharacterized protein n=1 Tax=virus sp. ctoYX9 TaxID=2825822 RepID=A0A8S5RNV5_9VIRU|nr:MAG TPA: hypothetical protein [virus sp. ctoYX9]
MILLHLNYFYMPPYVLRTKLRQRSCMRASL